MTCVQPGASCAGCSDTGHQGDVNTNLVCGNTYKVTAATYSGKCDLSINVVMFTA